MRTVRWCVLAACVALGAGCDSEPPLGAATGKVTFRGVPVAEGTVVFDGPDGSAYVADLEPNGTFAFQVARGVGLPPGRYAVAVRPPRPNKPGMGYVAPNMKKAEYPNIPKKYHDPKTSGLEATVQAGAATASFDFEMK
ncbi:carboxypeptidase regulatory-like domain-containing protein [Gemmata sp. JC717]|uniref:carboxypeptidase regulatory-like domain-containing protein n=1 Tax=Gemmata algarum TaxID=2975278 RepID=UPI0021BA5E34|nr:carboxypeptidase regulatory-like domain-containing protein [Gemmata algarum]MDY3553719.1 carboxypeptidase regulatory-like domain-containing protein [Gemmata algarum]